MSRIKGLLFVLLFFFVTSVVFMGITLAANDVDIDIVNMLYTSICSSLFGLLVVLVTNG